MRIIDADALMDDIKRDSKKAIDEGDKVGSFWLGHAAGLAIKQPAIQPEVLACGNGELVAQPEPTDIDAKEAVYNLAEKIGIHQLFALTVELRGEPIQPEPAIPLSWIEKYIEWLKSLDNEFANLAAAHISVMVKKWRDEQHERTD